MPVPVPPRSSAHAVNKVLSSDAPPPGLVKQSALKHLLNTLPEPPSGPPAAFTDRETWIKSLPPYRRYKLRQDAIPLGSAMSLVHVAEQRKEIFKTRIFPISVPSQGTSGITKTAPDSIVSNIASSPLPLVRVHAPLSNGKPWPPSPPKDIKQAIKADERRKAVFGDVTLMCDSGPDADDELSEEWTEDEAFFAGPTVHRQAAVKKVSVRSDNKESASGFSRPDLSQASVPVVEIDSDIDVPMAPFDGTLAADVVTCHVPDVKSTAVQPPVIGGSIHARDTAVIKETDHCAVSPARKALSPVPTTITPSDMIAYTKKIAEPMSEWVAEYIWKVVTHGMSLPPEFVANSISYGNTIRAYSTKPPAYLADSIRTLLCSTLLQPSAIFLALWYIARLPVFFGVFAYDAKKQSKEYKFRLELLGEGSTDAGVEKTRQLLEAHAPFRLLLLGVMLANKWLDDNTFSNKTWHQVSGVPMRALNRLESLGLDLLSHDLSMLPLAWMQWLEHVQSYHRSLAPYPEPIGPPRETPHNVIRRTIEELIVAGSPPLTTGVLPEPVFLGLADRKKERERERLAKEQLDLSSLDLDENGPLRDEYLLQRRKALLTADNNKRTREELERALPPPAEWSPAADPPIHRERTTYQAVQRPPPAPVPAHARAHLPEFLSQVLQANRCLDRTSTAFPDAMTQSELHVHGHVHRSSQCWSTQEAFNNSGQTECFAFPSHGPLSYLPIYNDQRPVVVTDNHSLPWSFPVLPVTRQPPVGGRYRPVGAFDAPPPSDLFRPTWLRT